MRTVQNWIFLRGLGREQAHWASMLSQCRERFPDRNFHALELPGCGELYRQSSPWSVAGIRHCLQHQLAELGLVGPCGLIALSFGAMVALEWLSCDTEEIDAIIVINTSARDLPLWQRLRPQAALRGCCALLSPSMRRREQLALAMVSRKHARDANVLDSWLEIQRRHPVSRRTLLAQLWAALQFSLPETLPAERGMVLSSSKDAMVSSRCSRAIALRYDWPLYCHPTAGHDLPLDDQGWLLEKFALFDRF